MHTSLLYGSLKTLGMIVIVTLAAALAYAGYMAIVHWSGIGV